MKIKAAAIIDFILTFLTFFTLFFLITSYFNRDIIVLIAAPLILSLLVCYLLKLFGGRKKKKTDDVEKYLFQFVCFGNDYCKGVVAQALSRRYAIENNGDYFKIGNAILALEFSLQPLTEEIIAKHYLKNKGKKLVIFSGVGFSKKAADLLASLPNITIKVLKFDEVYALLKSLDGLPTLEIRQVKEKHTFKKTLSSALTPSKAKGYFSVSLFLLFFSLFTPFSIFTIVVSCVNIVLGVLCRVGISKKLEGKSS